VKITTINIQIAGREYPVNVTPDTEELMQKAGAMVNEQIKSYSSAYAITDPRDLLAMCALQLAFQSLEKEQTDIQKLGKIESKVKAIELALNIAE
jgi:cell division protein ZapA (FtsZ GTPase activity inhibitor)